MGPCAWLGILHPAATALDESKVERAEATRRLTRLIQAVQRVFPCKHCRDHMMVNWGIPRVQNSMQKLMYVFHDQINMMLNKPPSPPFEGVRQRNVNLMRSQEWRKWAYAFMLYSSANCMPMMKNVDFNPCSMMRDMRRLIKAARRCGLNLSELPEEEKSMNCNSVWHVVDQYVKRENGRSVGRETVLEARVNCEHYKKGGENIAHLL